MVQYCSFHKNSLGQTNIKHGAQTFRPKLSPYNTTDSYSNTSFKGVIPQRPLLTGKNFLALSPFAFMLGWFALTNPATLPFIAIPAVFSTGIMMHVNRKLRPKI